MALPQNPPAPGPQAPQAEAAGPARPNTLAGSLPAPAASGVTVRDDTRRLVTRVFEHMAAMVSGLQTSPAASQPGDLLPPPLPMPGEEAGHDHAPPAPGQAPPGQARPPGAGILFPVQGGGRFSDDWHAPREGGKRKHMGNDIFAKRGTPVVAVVGGTIRYRDNRLGGQTVYLLGDDGNAYYYAHLDSRPAGLNGKRVDAGTVLGTVGTSGNATHTAPHLHFEVHAGGSRKNATNPFPLLRAAQEA